MQKKKEEEAARDKELNELFKVAISQPKVPVGMLSVALNPIHVAEFSSFGFSYRQLSICLSRVIRRNIVIFHSLT